MSPESPDFLPVVEADAAVAAADAAFEEDESAPAVVFLKPWFLGTLT